MKKTVYRLLSRLLLLASITLSIIAINSINAFANKFTEQAISQKTALVKVYGLTISDNSINLQLMSNGCTTTDFFKLQWQNNQLQVNQIKVDHCRRMPHKIWLKFTIPQQKNGFMLVNNFAF